MRSLVVLEDDLLFLSRIREAAGATPVKVVRSAAALVEACRQQPGALVLADLDSPRLEAVAGDPCPARDPALARQPVIGFFSHVHAQRGREAQAAGATRVLARGAFAQALPELLAGRLK
jgi:DNA-binding NarL/FixJ family response regulator